MKSILFKTFKFAAITAAVGQLALSQIHIGVITKVFAPPVGFFLFLFITFGVVMAFNAMSFNAGVSPAVLLFGGIAACTAGIIYLKFIFADLQAGNLLTFDEAEFSVYLSLAAVVIYAASTVVLLATRNFDD